MELDEFVRLAHSLGYTGGGAPALPPAVGAVGAGGGWGDEGTRRAGELVVLLGGVSDLPAGAGAAYAVLHVGSRRVHSAPLPPQPGASSDSWQRLSLEVDANTALRGQLGAEVMAWVLTLTLTRTLTRTRTRTRTRTLTRTRTRTRTRTLTRTLTLTLTR